MTMMMKLLFVAMSALALSACQESDGQVEALEPAAEMGGPTDLEARKRLPTPAPSEPSLADYAADARAEITPENVEEKAAALEEELQEDLNQLQ